MHVCVHLPRWVVGHGKNIEGRYISIIYSIFHRISTGFCCAFLCHSYSSVLLHCHCVNRLTHWGRVTHICVSKLTIIGSNNGLSPSRRQAIIWTNAGILLIWTLGTNFSEILSEIHAFSFKKMHLKMSSAKWRPFCLGLNVLTIWVKMTGDKLQ